MYIARPGHGRSIFLHFKYLQLSRAWIAKVLVQPVPVSPLFECLGGVDCATTSEGDLWEGNIEVQAGFEKRGKPKRKTCGGKKERKMSEKKRQKSHVFLQTCLARLFLHCFIIQHVFVSVSHLTLALRQPALSSCLFLERVLSCTIHAVHVLPLYIRMPAKWWPSEIAVQRVFIRSGGKEQ